MESKNEEHKAKMEALRKRAEILKEEALISRRQSSIARSKRSINSQRTTPQAMNEMFGFSVFSTSPKRGKRNNNDSMDDYFNPDWSQFGF